MYGLQQKVLYKRLCGFKAALAFDEIIACLSKRFVVSGSCIHSVQVGSQSNIGK